MLAIVTLHSGIAVAGEVGLNPHLAIAFGTPLKFATIAFFLISGFLLGERVDRRDPVAYFVRRVKTVFVPWAVWFALTCAVLVIHGLLLHRLGPAPLIQLGRLTHSAVSCILLTTAFWFVPNLLFSIAILLIFRRHLYSLRLGAALLALNLVYAVNIYSVWFPPGHSQAIFGFVFYLWLGSYAAHHFAAVERLLARVPAALLFALSLATALASYAEADLLSVRYKGDPLNTLRFSNQLFSVCVVLLIFKCKRALWPRFVDVRRHTFGLYLSHSMALMIVMYPLTHAHHSTARPFLASDQELFVLWLSVAALTYLSCFALTRWLGAHPATHWLIGIHMQTASPNSGDEEQRAHGPQPAFLEASRLPSSTPTLAL
jgi:membrane-bound acyltransferase YfiQ involved in biofilm formation